MFAWRAMLGTSQWNQPDVLTADVSATPPVRGFEINQCQRSRSSAVRRLKA